MVSAAQLRVCKTMPIITRQQAKKNNNDDKRIGQDGGPLRRARLGPPVSYLCIDPGADTWTGAIDGKSVHGVSGREAADVPFLDDRDTVPVYCHECVPYTSPWPPGDSARPIGQCGESKGYWAVVCCGQYTREPEAITDTLDAGDLDQDMADRYHLDIDRLHMMVHHQANNRVLVEHSNLTVGRVVCYWHIHLRDRGAVLIMALTYIDRHVTADMMAHFQGVSWTTVTATGNTFITELSLVMVPARRSGIVSLSKSAPEVAGDFPCVSLPDLGHWKRHSQAAGRNGLLSASPTNGQGDVTQTLAELLESPAPATDAQWRSVVEKLMGELSHLLTLLQDANLKSATGTHIRKNKATMCNLRLLETSIRQLRELSACLDPSSAGTATSPEDGSDQELRKDTLPLCEDTDAACSPETSAACLPVGKQSADSSVVAASSDPQSEQPSCPSESLMADKNPQHTAGVSQDVLMSLLTAVTQMAQPSHPPVAVAASERDYSGPYFTRYRPRDYDGLRDRDRDRDRHFRYGGVSPPRSRSRSRSPDGKTVSTLKRALDSYYNDRSKFTQRPEAQAEPTPDKDEWAAFQDFKKQRKLQVTAEKLAPMVLEQLTRTQQKQQKPSEADSAEAQQSGDKPPEGGKIDDVIKLITGLYNKEPLSQTQQEQQSPVAAEVTVQPATLSSQAAYVQNQTTSASLKVTSEPPGKVAAAVKTALALV